MASLELGFLGPLQIKVNYAPARSFESDKARALLAYLAVESNHPHRRDALLGLFWPDCSEEAARHNLRQTLYNVRLVIGDRNADPPYLLVTRDEVQFNTASAYSLDVDNFKAGLENCDRHLPRCIEACPIHAERLEKALDIYRGPFLEEFFLPDSADFEEWAIRQREALHRAALEGLTYLANYYEQSRRYDAAQRFALRQLELDPWREESHRQLMGIYAASGQRTAALAQYETCRRVLTKELGVEPSAETRGLYEQIKREDPAAVGRKEQRPDFDWNPPRLAAETTPFVGREEELAQLTQLLDDPNCRLLTLVGPGGIGKTRLALKVASNLHGRFSHGAVFVSLTGLTSSQFVVSAIANATGFVFDGPNDPKLQLLRFLRGKQLLLVLDNAEDLGQDPLSSDGASLFIELVKAVPGAKLLVTSREQLNFQGEWVFEVGGLAVPASGPDDAFEETSAVALFLQRARRARIGFAVRPGEREAIVHICQLVGGIPLAIELAAAWVRTLGCDDIAREIEQSLDFLTTSLRDLPERHRSMRAVFDYSWRLLSEKERHLLSALAVFHGGFTREAAEVVAGANLQLLSALITKSLVRRMPSGRYDLHELVRQYAASKLAESPDELQATEDGYSSYYMDFVAAREKDLKSARQPGALKEISEDIENIRAAWRLAVTRGHVTSIQRQLKAFWLYYEMRGGLKEAESLLGWAVSELGASSVTRGQPEESFEIALACLCAQQGWFCLKLGKLEEARKLVEPSAATLASLGAVSELLYAVHYLWAIEWVGGNSARARELVLQQLDLATQTGDEWEIALAEGTLGRTNYLNGEYREALMRLTRANTIFETFGDPGMIALTLSYLGPVQTELGMLEAAEDSLQKSAALSRTLSDRWNLAKSLGYLGVLAQAQKDFAKAIHLLKESLTMFEELGALHDAITTLNDLGSAMLMQGADGDAQEAFLKALELSWDSKFLPEALEALLGIGQCRMKQGQPVSSVMLFDQVLGHPSSTAVIRDSAEQLYVHARSLLTPEELDAAREEARAKGLKDIVQGILRDS